MKTPQKSTSLLLFFVLTIFLFFQIFPFYNNYRIQGDDKVFSGFIMRWNDNNTYIAKMKQGFEGEWLFTLDYAQEKGEGALIYPLYLGLGHLVRIFNLDYLWTFHVARILAGILMFFSLFRLIQGFFQKKKDVSLIIILLAVLAGSGFSWISFYFSNDLTSMLEAFPHNATFVNIHFPLTLACMFFIFTPYKTGSREWFHYLIYFILSAVCGFVSSFAVVVLIVVLGLVFIVRWRLKLAWQEAFYQWIIVGNGGGWIILYQFWVLKTNPDFILWSQQNIIGKISLFNFLLSFSPYICIALIGIVYFVQNSGSISEEKLSVYIWGISIPLMLLIPGAISTRFLIGGFVPFVLISFDFLFKRFPSSEDSFIRISSLLSFFLILAEISILYLLGQQHVNLDEVSIFIPRGVYEAYLWIDENLEADSVILTDHYTGNYIPRYTDSIPTLGHWCETPYAYEKDVLVKAFFAGEVDVDFLVDQGVDYIFYGPNEKNFGDDFDVDPLKIIYENDDVTLFEIN